MKINLNPKTFLTPVNQQTKHIAQSMNQSNSSKKDTVSIGLQARHLFNGGQQKNSLIESLMKQRENIQEMKSKLTERTLENGGDLSGIKEQLKDFEKQLAEIDTQIAQAQKKKEEEADYPNKEVTAKTAEEAIITQAGTLEQAKTLGRMDRSLAREKATLESEMKLDAERGVHSELKAGRLTELEGHFASVQEKLAEKLNEKPAKFDRSEMTDSASLRQQVGAAESLEAVQKRKEMLTKISPDMHYGYTLSVEINKLNAQSKQAANEQFLSVQTKAENLFKAYKNVHDEIEQGYENGTRELYVVDESSESGYRLLTKEEELAGLDEAYKNRVVSFNQQVGVQQNIEKAFGKYKAKLANIYTQKAMLISMRV